MNASRPGASDPLVRLPLPTLIEHLFSMTRLQKYPQTMRDVETLARALRMSFGGDPLKAADVAGIVVRRASGDGGAVRGAYLPATRSRERGWLMLHPEVRGEERERLISIGVGHHFLRHRTRAAYAYHELGPFEPDRETAEAVHFGLTFVRGVDEEPIDFLERSMRRLHG